MAHWGMEDVQACFGDTADLNTRQITVGGQRLGLLFLDVSAWESPAKKCSRSMISC